MLTTNIFQPDKPIKMEAKDEQQKHGSERNLSERDNSPSLHDYDNNDADDNNDASSLLSYSDVESFQGKIVYNPDGIAYIIDSENETSYSANDNLQMSSNNPRIHSFRVVSARDADAPNSKNQEQSSSSSSQENNNRQHKLEKPVLMCFICKLSFGNTKSFQLHAHSEHTLNLIESEKLLLSREYSSAIIQRNIDEKPQISFLEPLMDPRLNPIRKLSPNPESQNASSPTKMSSNNSTSNPDLSNIDASFMNMMNRMNGNGQATNLSTKFGSNSALNQLTSSPSPKISDNAQCPDHYGMKEMFDCKKCEININANLSDKSPNPLSQCSPSIHSNAASPASSGLNISPTAPSFTIGACPEHINGRPIGIECARCEMVLNTVRLNSGVQMSTRNSCKTLKCPQCNWHYKYQETLEIHMREKHPDGASACGYCLAGQQHPRLARGESYTCGYKPYRCEICNYSTTTKGNLSIHMQSDKHLNNMQELNNTQNNLVITSSAGSICNYPAAAKETSPVHQQNEKLLTNLQELNNSQNNMVTTLSATSIQNYLTPTKSSLPLHAKPENLMSNAPELNNSHNNVKPSPSATATSPDENTIRETAKIMLANMHSQATSTSRDENNLRETSKLLFGNMHAQPPTATPLADLGMRDSSKIMLTNMLAQATTASQQSYGGIRETSQMMLINIHLQAVQQQQCMVDVAQQLLAAISGVTKIVQQQPKPRPCFRCDVCSYETSVARNLRIHLTSEKHTHIMTVLQNNIKHLQALSFLQSFSIGIGQTRNQFAELQNFLLEAVLADIAYNEALNIQLLHQNSPASPQPPPRTPSSAEDYGNCQNQSSSPPSPQPPPRTPSHAEDYGNGNNDNSPPSPEPPQRSSSAAEDYSGRQNDIDPPPTESDVRPTTYFSCLVCQTFDTNNIDELNMHLLIDRARNNTLNDVMLVVNNNYICSLCNYETNLKANFQLHTKTDKHILKLSHINHIREGGPKNEYKIRALIQSERKNSNRNSNQNDKLLNTVQLKCNCCDYYTNSIQKLNIHATSLRHENMKVMFDMWTNWINQ